jgi:localization factor PodJL
VRYKRKSHRDYGDDEESIGDDLAAINDRLDDLTRNLDRLAQANHRRSTSNHDDTAPDRVSDALARLDPRLDQVIAEARNAPLEAQRRAMFAALEHQLRQITSQIASLHQPYEDALSALRSDLAEVGRALKDAMPRQAVETLEAEVRALSERIGRSKQADGDPAALAKLEQGLAEVRDALRNLAPAENLIGFEDAVRGLSHKIDQLSANASTGTGPDPAVFQQLDEAITAMRHIGSHVASDEALAQLAAEVHGLATRFEHATENAGNNQSLARLESQISALLESGRSLPPDLEAIIHSLNERLDRMQVGQSDQAALGGLAERIVKLVERLDSYDHKLSSLDTLQRGMADVLTQLEEMRKASARAPRVVNPIETAPAPSEPPAAAMPFAPQLPPPVEVLPPSSVPAELTGPPRAKNPRPAPPRVERRSLDPDLPPDTPLEPGSGIPRSKPGSPAARIAASEAALGGARPPTESGGKSAAMAAARKAAMSYQFETVDPAAPRRSLSSLLSWFKSKKPKLPKPPKTPKAPEPPKPPEVPTSLDPSPAALTFRQKVSKQIKTLVIAVSVVIIILGTLQTAVDFFMAPPAPQPAPSAPLEDRAPEVAPPLAPSTAPAARPPGRSMPSPDDSAPLPEPAPEPDTTQSTGRTSQRFDPTTVLAGRKPQPPAAEITGAIDRLKPTGPATSDPAVNALPATFGSTLRAAAASGDHGAEFEIAARYAEGRGIARNMDEAVRWLERGASAGFAPAQFRLAAIYEKAEGVRKDLIQARRLYTAAAEKGHAKAMHNLAVLYAEGFDGRPDYRAAAHWFRRAAAYGVADSQFNLAILYARGTGIEQNLAESYKWFALVANTGDQDAARKRDEVATRLDQQTIMAAKLAAQTFTPQREPGDAVSVKAPSGGWDRNAAAAQPVKPKHRPRAFVAP